MESDADTFYEVKAVELRQLAWLAGQFREALILSGIPTDTTHDLLCAWFDEELATTALEVDDDD